MWENGNFDCKRKSKFGNEKPLLWILKYNLIRNKDMSSGVHKVDH